MLLQKMTGTKYESIGTVPIDSFEIKNRRYHQIVRVGFEPTSPAYRAGALSH